MSCPLYSFLSARRTEKGKEWNITGMSSSDKGTYYISNEDYEEFLSLHYEHVFIKNNKSSLLEKHSEFSPILIDLDFRYETKDITRVFTKDQIYNFVKQYSETFYKFIDYKESLRFFVELKPEATLDKDIKKDGIHIICPDINLDYSVLFTLRKYLLEKNITSCFSDFTNSPSDCFDESVIKRNNWFLHGATKPLKSRYSIVYCFIADPDGTFEETEWDETDKDLTYLFSLNYKRSKATKINIKSHLIDEWKMWDSISDTKPELSTTKKNPKILKDETMSIQSELSDGISKILNLTGCLWDISEMSDGYKLTHNTNMCLIQNDIIHKEIGHSCLYVQKSHSIFNCYSHKSKRLPKQKSEKLYKLLSDEEDSETIVESEYKRIKEEFEKTTFRIRNPPGYMVFIANEWVRYNRHELIDMNSGIFLDSEKKKRFIDEWLKDDSIKTYDKMDYFIDTKEHYKNIFNTFTGFQAIHIKEDSKCIDIILNHIKILCNHNSEAYEFVIDWFAQILQQPNKLTGICLILNGQHGCGKDMFLSWFGTKIIGLSNYFKTARPHIDLFGSFNSSRKNIVFYHIEEGNDMMLNESNIQQFKNYITDSFASIQLKGKDTTNLIQNYNHFAISTNSSTPFKIEKTERRFFGIQASSETCANSEYFSELEMNMNDQGVIKGFYEFLISRDISKRDWKILPTTEYMKAMFEASLSEVNHFINELLEIDHTQEQIKASELYKLYKEWCRNNGESKPKSLIIFGNILTSIKELSKFRKKDGIYYIISKKPISESVISHVI